MGRVVEDIGNTFEDAFGSLKSSFNINRLTNPLSRTRKDLKKLSSPFTPKIPKPEEPTIIPLPDEGKLELESKKRLAAQRRTGRESTILTEGLGG